MKYRYLYIFLILFLTCSANGFAQYNYQQLDNSYGLSNSCINGIYQDSDNLIWFATWDGLNYYNGNNIHVFNYEKSDLNKNSISSNVIYQVTEDKKRNIWIGTVEGLSKFNKNTGDFSNYLYSHQKALSNGYTIAINNKGDVYAARVSSSQLLHYDEKTDAFAGVPLKVAPGLMLVKMLFDEKGNL